MRILKNLTVNLHCMQNNFADKLATPWHFSSVKARLYKKSFAPIFRTETLSQDQIPPIWLHPGSDQISHEPKKKAKEKNLSLFCLISNPRND